MKLISALLFLLAAAVSASAATLSPDGTAITAPTTATVVGTDGTWSFGPVVRGTAGYEINLNGKQSNGIGKEIEIAGNGHAYVLTELTPATWWMWAGAWIPSDAPPSATTTNPMQPTIGGPSVIDCSSGKCPSDSNALTTDYNNDLVYLGSGFTYTLAQSGSSGFPAGWNVCVVNISQSGSATITTTTSIFKGGGSGGSPNALTLPANSGACIVSDGTNYGTLK